jgi:hypothetical protein
MVLGHKNALRVSGYAMRGSGCAMRVARIEFWVKFYANISILLTENYSMMERSDFHKSSFFNLQFSITDSCRCHRTHSPHP